jgi:two-component system, LytTR family, sensor kinase
LENRAFSDYLQGSNEILNKEAELVQSRHSNRANDNWFTILGLSLSIFQRYTNETRIYVPKDKADTLIVGSFIILHVLTWLLIVYTVRKVRKRYSGTKHSFRRFVVTSSICLCIFFFLNIASVCFANYLKPDPSLAINAKNVSQYFAKVVLGIWMIVGMYEAMYQQFLLKETQRQKNELLRLQMQQQIDNLKGKVNPHFLFNSLNTLSSLIYTDTDKAELFVEELSAVYRYLLKNFDDDLATLKEEIDFINSFFILVKIRFVEGIAASIKIDDRLNKHKLPAISLQLLVENAIQHNIVSKETPLHITISTENETLVVKNNLQKKPQTVPGVKMGLNYIISKYAMVNKKGVEINDEKDEFIVRLPLIQPVDEVETITKEIITPLSA